MAGIRARTIFLPIIIFALFGCDPSKGKQEAEGVADHIHAQVGQKDFAAIYKEASDTFRETGSESDFVRFMESFASSAGAFKKATEIAWEAGYDSRVGRIYSLIYDLEFDNGTAREKLILRAADRGTIKLHAMQLGGIQQNDKPAAPKQTT